MYFDEEEINRSQKSIQTPMYMEASLRLAREVKVKNPELKSNSYIEIEPEEEYFDSDCKYKERRPMLEKGELDKLNTVRSN